MSAMTLDRMRAVAEDLELAEQRRRGGNRQDARLRLARHLGWSPGTLYNLARERLKKLDGDLREQLAAYAIKDVENEIATLRAKLESYRALAVAPDQEVIRRVDAAILTATHLRAALTGEVSGA